MEKRLIKWLGWILFAALLLAAQNATAGDSSSKSTDCGFSGLFPDHFCDTRFIPNVFWTTQYGPAYADILLQKENFLACKGGPFALCYYSGPEPVACIPTEDGRFANCRCYEIAYGPYYVDINSILNLNVYLETVRKCGSDGSLCTETNSAPVCRYINRGKLIPGADLISTFSFNCVPTQGIGQTNCATASYAGCMTAPCYRTGTAGIVECKCPIYEGPYQVGEFGAQCDLALDLVWSAAYNPNVAGKTYPELASCVPDAPGEIGCPLYVPGTTVLPPDSGVDCNEVCNEYAACQTSTGLETGFACDATLCTANCGDRDLVSLACSGLQDCDISEIIKAEQAAQCSCCASQLCGCTSNTQTDKAIARLNQLQRDRGIIPQCDQNGTLCGS